MNYKNNLQLIVDILNFDSSTLNLSNRLKSGDIDWEEIVALASRHLVLTTCYCRLKQKQLIHLLPEDLIEYLKHISEINRNRNANLIIQAHSISNLLTKHSIKHIYFKGMGLLLAGKFEDSAERMIGDIDILIDSSRIQKAYSILKQNGYNESKGFNYEVKDFRHLPRLINQDMLAAVELHDHILKKKQRHLLNLDDVFLNANNLIDTYVPSDKDQFKINVLTSQINNQNYYYNSFSIKCYYNSLVLEKTNNNLLTDSYRKNKFYEAYFQKYNYWKGQNTKQKVSLIQKLRFLSYKLKVNHKPLESLIHVVKYCIYFIFHRIYIIISNPSYRSHILKNKIFNKTSSNLIL